MSITRPYFPQLDGVRAIAALMVMGFHFCQFKNIRGIAVFGQTGVDLFFVLSGFLITTILLAAGPRNWREIRTFYIRRTLRIFPLYYGYLIVSSLLGSAISIWYWIYLQNVAIAVGAITSGPNHFWSLAVEEQFYLVWPFLVLFLPRRWLVTTLWSLIGLALLSRFLLMGRGIDSFYFTLSRLDGLSAGALLAVYYQRRVLYRRRSLLMSLAAISAVLLCVQWWKFHAHSLPWVGATKLSLGTMFYASVVGYLVVSPSHPVNRLLAAAPTRFTGRISYGLYVFHPAIFAFIFTRLAGVRTSVQLVACFAGVYFVSVVSWYAMESRFLRLKDRVAPEASAFRDVAISVPDGVG